MRGISSRGVKHRRTAAGVLATVVLLAAILSPAALGADSPLLDQPITDRGVSLELAVLVELPDNDRGPSRINQMVSIDDRFFAVDDIGGRIYEIDRSGSSASASLFLDVGSAIAAATDGAMNTDNLFHGGLRGVAFHPEFANNGLFYTTVMEDRPANPNAADYLSDVANPVSGDGVLIEWQANPATGAADPASYRQVFRVGIPVYDHPIKQLAFNPFSEPGDADYGLLYIGHGDGSVRSATAGGGLNNDALGKVLRIDPRPSNGRAFSIPADNPFVGDPSMLDAVYSLGHRNPHHLAFAEDASGAVHLLVAEPGRDNVEEVNIVVAGGNYGWSDREGTFVHLTNGEGLVTGVAELPANDAVNGYTYPAIQFGHQGEPGAGFGGQAIAGGFVVDNGSELSGQYFFSDFPLTGDIYHAALDDMVAAVTTLDPDDPQRDAPEDLSQAQISRVSITFDHDADPATPAVSRAHPRDVFDDSPNYNSTTRSDVRIGEGPDGEMYVSSKQNGTIYLVVNSLPVDPVDPTPQPPEPPAVQRMCQGRAPTVDGTVGTSGDDVIVGTGGADVISGGGGNDLICAFGGADRVDGGDGDDVIYGGWGADVILAGPGNDRVFAGPGLDNVEGGGGLDELRGGPGGDRLVGNSGDDRLFGSDGIDRLFGYSGNDRLFGGGGADNLRGGAGVDQATGGAGIDLCVTSESTVGCELSER